MIDGFSMNDYMGQTGVAVNPDYGQGHFNRRIRLQKIAGGVLAELEDCSHAFRIHLYHDDAVVTELQAEAIRYPKTGCIGAPEQLKALQGLPRGLSASEYVLREHPKAHCTHLYDLALLALAHTAREDDVRQIDIIIPDELDQPVKARVFINGDEVLCWDIQAWQVVAPYAGKPVYRGFAQWAEELLTGDEKEAGFALQKSYMVAQARRFDADAMVEKKPGSEVNMHGACFNYSPGVLEDSQRIKNTLRDFTHAEEQLLQFK
jgi:hypothetical protein